MKLKLINGSVVTLNIRFTGAAFDPEEQQLLVTLQGADGTLGTMAIPLHELRMIRPAAFPEAPDGPAA